MQHSIFGTDGIRGRVGSEPVTPMSLVKIGYCFAKEMFGNDKGIVIIGHDGRESSDMIIKNLSVGISAQGSEVQNSGLISTPALAVYLNIKSIESIVGIQVTASHNNYRDNCMKFFNHTGIKISQINESNINSLFYNLESNNYQDVIIRKSDISIKETYLEFIKNYISTKLPILLKSSKKLSIIIDCANGALSESINEILDILPIKYSLHNTKPDGKNINDNCGSTKINYICDVIYDLNCKKSESIDLGVSFDGDGDRVIFVDEDCHVFDGDDVVFLLSQYLSESTSCSRIAVGTFMTNYGIRNLYKIKNINFLETEVGDKYVLEEIKKNNAIIGGESSGHIIINNDNLLLGDGIITFLHVLEMLLNQNKKLGDYREIINKLPSKLINIRVQDKESTLSSKYNQDLIKKINNSIGREGRILVRASGTEDLIRVLVEHSDVKQLNYFLDYFCDNIKKH